MIQPHDAAHEVLVTAAGVRLVIDRHTGAIVELGLESGAVLASEPVPMLVLGLRAPATGEARIISSAHAHDITVSRLDEVLHIGFAGWDGLVVDATITAAAQADGSIGWTAEVHVEGDLVIEWLEGPGVTVPHDLSGPDGPGRILWPWNEGVVVDDLSVRAATGFRYHEPSYPSGGVDAIYPGAVCSQFLAHYGDAGGVYLAAHDAAGTPKMVDYRRVGSSIQLVIRILTGGAAGHYRTDFSMVLACFQGDWHTAAELYRTWFDEVTELTRTRVRDDLPQWCRASPLVVTYPVRGTHDTGDMAPNQLFPYHQALAHLDRLAQDCGVPVMALLMHWEGTAPWAPPYVWPPYGGADALQHFADELHRHGHLLGLYCSGLGWTQRSRLVPDYDRTEDFAAGGWSEVMCRAPDGSLPPSHICPDQRVGYDLCPAHPRVLEVLTSQVRQMAEIGTDYIQLFDQNHGGHSYFCYDTSHGHGYGPGRWQTERMQELHATLAENDGTPVVLGAESAAGEPYIQSLAFNDLRFELGFAFGAPVPLYQFLYGQYATNFMGNQVGAHHFIDVDASPDNLLYRLGYAVVAGELMTLPITDTGEVSFNWGADWGTLPDQAAVLALVSRLCHWRTGQAERFLTGKMLTPWSYETRTRRIVLRRGGHLCVPAVLASRWCSGDDVSAQLFVNWGTEEEHLRIADESDSLLIIEGPQAAPRQHRSGEPVVVPALDARLVISADPVRSQPSTWCSDPPALPVSSGSMLPVAM